MSRLVPSSLSHLAGSHLDYLRHWCHLLHLESLATTAYSPGGTCGIWLQSAAERSVVVCCLPKRILNIIACSLKKNDQILIVFGASILDRTLSLPLGEVET